MDSTAMVRYAPVFRIATGEIHVVEVVPARGVDAFVLDEVRRQAAAWERGGIGPRIAFGRSEPQDRSCDAAVGRALRWGPPLGPEGMTALLRKFPVASG